MELIKRFNEIEQTGRAIAGYTCELCGYWTLERFEGLSDVLYVKSSDLVVANQRHTDRVLTVGTEDSGYGVTRPHTKEPFDAMITKDQGLVLCVHTADCVPIVFLDPVGRAAGIAHSGWVGTAGRIAGKTVRKMAEEFGCRPENILCAMGPYNHSCCYEVGEDVLERFSETFSDAECAQLFSKKDEPGKYLLDLGRGVSLSLRKEGVDPEKIYDSGYCTYHTSLFSSWRRSRDKKHQIITYIALTF
ncbi:MAG: peptidoglycan editing factor PgeF [Lachnospiraceae bacterium]|nr:peptidoglycan editing factor PgeF [Lachnospiraceae bacterium]